jgi:hypothetical protein
MLLVVLSTEGIDQSMLQALISIPHCDQDRKKFCFSTSAWPLLIRQGISAEIRVIEE